MDFIKRKTGIVLVLAVLVAAVIGCSPFIGPEVVVEAGTQIPVEEGMEGETPALCLQFDNSGKLLTKGISTAFSKHVTVTEPSAGKYVLTINLRPTGEQAYTSAMFSIYNDGNPSGYSINIADSATCNGWGGDAGTQTHDSELQVQNNKMMIFQSDLGGRTSIELPADSDSEANAVHNFLPGGTNRRIEIGNNRVSWWTGSSYLPSETVSVGHKNIFALDGQNDPEGPENYTIYAAFNRTVYSASRSGSGITTVYVYLKNVVQPAPVKVVKLLATCADSEYPNPRFLVEEISLDPNGSAPAGYNWVGVWYNYATGGQDTETRILWDQSLNRSYQPVVWGYDSRNLPIISLQYFRDIGQGK